MIFALGKSRLTPGVKVRYKVGVDVKGLTPPGALVARPTSGSPEAPAAVRKQRIFPSTVLCSLSPFKLILQIFLPSSPQSKPAKICSKGSQLNVLRLASPSVLWFLRPWVSGGPTPSVPQLLGFTGKRARNLEEGSCEQIGHPCRSLGLPILPSHSTRDFLCSYVVPLMVEGRASCRVNSFVTFRHKALLFVGIAHVTLEGRLSGFEEFLADRPALLAVLGLVGPSWALRSTPWRSPGRTCWDSAVPSGTMVGFTDVRATWSVVSKFTADR